MSRPASAPPVLTVRYEGAEHTFAPGHDVVVGRDLRADVRVAHPLISRAHVILRHTQGRWTAVDNGSLNGIYADGRRVPSVELRDGGQLVLGDPGGPRLSFEVGRHRGPAGRPPQTTALRVDPRGPGGHGAASGTQPAARHGGLRPPGPPSPTAPTSQPWSPPYAQPRSPSAPHSAPSSRAQPRQVPPRPLDAIPASEPATRMGPTAAPRQPDGGGNLATSMLKILRPGRVPDAPPGSVRIGRATDNDIVVNDVLASRHHATLVTTASGAEIRDQRSINGTFVNGVRVDSAPLTDGDVVTIGNVDLVYAGGSLARRTETTAAAGTGGLEVQNITWVVEGDKKLLDDITLAARPGTLTALIGPSGAGKSTLAKLVAGYTQPTGGSVSFEGHDIHAEYASLRSRIGMVPQDDVVHGQLTVMQALMYAAELRLPPDTTRDDRRAVVTEVLAELEMTRHADTRVDKLSGGQRKRASVALELLTGPSLLILDEPTSGLDPALDRQVMTMLRQLADAGRVVLVVTHSLTYLDVCDQVLLLAPGGKTAFYGPPPAIGHELGTTNWADIFSGVAGDPDGAQARYLARHGASSAAAPARPAAVDLGEPTRTSLRRQFSTIGRRQLRLIVSDRGYFVFLAMLPFIMGVLALAVPGTVGFGVPDPLGLAANEPGQLLVLLNVGAVFMGTALTVRDLIGERPIFRREQAVGLSTSAYLLAKVSIYTVFALLQSAIVVGIVLLGKPGPSQGAAAVGNGGFELYLDIAATCVASAMVGLALSALARSSEQIMPLLVVAVMSQLVFNGGMIPVTDRLVLDQLSWLTPARWGFAASASTVDLTTLVPGPITPKDRHWEHTAGAWGFDMAMLGAICLGYLGLVRWRIRLPR